MKKINPHDHVSRHQLTLKAGETRSFCRCWRSKTFPLCDGSHRDYTQTQNHDDVVGPLTVSVAQKVEEAS